MIVNLILCGSNKKLVHNISFTVYQDLNVVRGEVSDVNSDLCEITLGDTALADLTTKILG